MPIGVYCLNVGQGACIAIIDAVKRMRGTMRQASIIDIGADGAKLLQWLRFVRVQHIPFVAATHNDADHICGLEQMVYGYAGKINTLLFVPDRPEQDIPFWCDAQSWVQDGLVKEVGQLTTPMNAAPGMGRILVEPPQTTYRLHCTYPTMFDTAAAVRGAKRIRGKLDSGPNATSAVIRLARQQSRNRTVILFGGDLNFPGWASLRKSAPKHDLNSEVFIVPHHGAPRYPRKSFAHQELAEAVSPQHALISAGTHQKHVRRGRERQARHPHVETVRALRQTGATVVCTQITDRCLDDPENYPDGSILPMLASQPNVNLSNSGCACAGTVVLTIKSRGPVDVMHLNDHQTAVNGLTSCEHPVCRP